MTTELLPKSIQERVILNYKKGMSMEMSISKAFEQEQGIILSMLNGSFTNEYGKEMSNKMSKMVYNKIKNVYK